MEPSHFTDSVPTFAFENDNRPQGRPILDRFDRMGIWDYRLERLPGIGKRHPLLEMIIGAIPEGDPNRSILLARTAFVLENQIPAGFTLEEYTCFMTAALKVNDLAQSFVLYMAAQEVDLDSFNMVFRNLTPDAAFAVIKRAYCENIWHSHLVDYKIRNSSDSEVIKISLQTLGKLSKNISS